MLDAINNSLFTLFEASLRATLLALAAASILFIGRVKNRNIHHRVWGAVLAAMLLLPVFQLTVPPIHVPQQLVAYLPFISGPGSQPGDDSEAAPRMHASAQSLHAASAGNSRVNDSDSVPLESRNAPVTADIAREVNPGFQYGANGPAENRSDAEGLLRLSWLTTVFYAYVLGVLIFLSRFALGLWTASRLIKRCRPLGDLSASTERVFECDGVRVPMTIGILRPCILLPTEWTTWSKDLLAAVLQHEQAHVDRKDCFFMAIAELNRCLYWFHPLAWFLRRNLAALAETTCDDYVITALGDRHGYAQHLLEIASRMTGDNRRTTAAAIFMARSSQVESRIDAILDVTRPLARRLRWRETLAIATVMASVIIVTTALHAEVNGATEPSQDQVGNPNSDEVHADLVASGAEGEQPGSKASDPPTPPAPGVDLYGDALPRGATARLGALRYRHPGSMWKRIAFLPDNQTFVVGGWSEMVRLWDARSGRMTHEIDLGGSELVAFCASPDGKAIATLAVELRLERRDFRIQLVVWDTETWGELGRVTWNDRGAGHAQQIAFSPDGRVIGMCLGDGTLRLWEVATGKETVRPSGFQDQVESIQFSPNGDLVATAGRQGVVLWNIGADEAPQKLSGLPEGAGVVRFSPDGTLLAVGNFDDGVARLFNVQSRQVVLDIRSQDKSYSREGMCFSADGKQLIVPSSARFIEFFDIDTGRSVRRLDAQAIVPQGVAASPDGRLLACIGNHAAMNVWDLESGERISDAAVGHLDAAADVAFTPDDRRVATSSMDGTIRLWDAATGQQERVLAHDRWVAAFAISRSGQWIVSCGLDDTVRLWETATGKEAYKVPGHGNTGGNHTMEVAFSPDGERFHSFGTDMVLRTYDTQTGKTLNNHAIHPIGVTVNKSDDPFSAIPDDPYAPGAKSFSLDQVLFTPDASFLLVGGRSEGKIRIFDVKTGREVDVIESNEPWQSFLVSPDGTQLTTFEQLAPTNPTPGRVGLRTTTLCVRDFASKKVVRERLLTGPFTHRAAYSPDGKLIGFTQRDKLVGDGALRWKVSVVNVETLEEIAQIEVQPNSVRSLAFSHDGARLAIGRDDSTVLLWDLDQVRTDHTDVH